MPDDQSQANTAVPAQAKPTISLGGFFDKAFSEQNNQPATASANQSPPANVPVAQSAPNSDQAKIAQPSAPVQTSLPSASAPDQGKTTQASVKEKTIDTSGDGHENAVDTTPLDNNDIGSLVSGNIVSIAQLAEVIEEGYIPKIVAAIINFSMNNRASDVHIEPQTKSMRIRTRTDGILTDIAKLSLEMHPPMISRIKILAKLKLDEARIPQDGRFDVTFSDRQTDVRVSTLPTVHGEKAVMRILDKNQKILTLEDLGMKGDAFDKTIAAISKPWGVILSTGPTGSGKSTTLNAIIARLNQPGVNICTLEDPVEYETPGVNQSQVKPDIGFTFATGLRSLLRQDPNIIMVGEVRDGETAGMVTHAALTGHLVLTTLHTNDTAGALPRLINMGIEPFLITSSMDLVIAQRLVRLICPKCKEEMRVPPKLLEEIESVLKTIPQTNKKDLARIPAQRKFYYGRGCSECKQGYKGRIGLFEVMGMTSEIEDFAIAHKSSSDIKAASIKAGMITMKQDGVLKALEGLTTLDEVFQATMDN